MNVIAIESSCDETAVAVVTGARQPTVVVNVISSQIELHRKTNGIVPELAARAQLPAMIPVLNEALAAAAEHGVGPFDAIAVTKGPGLIGSLLVGVETAKTLAAAWQLPVYGIHHIEGHIYSAFAGIGADQIQWPVLVLVVSGGHTQLVLMRQHFQYEIIGSTRDDAAGEAFDKIARLLDLPYPGGPAISQLAAEHVAQCQVNGQPLASTYNLPRPMLTDPSLDFSFSGLKTAVLYTVKGPRLDRTTPLTDEAKWALAWEVEQAIVDVLIAKTEQAIGRYAPRQIALVGGVSANTVLRERFAALSSVAAATNATDANVSTSVIGSTKVTSSTDQSVEVLVVPREYSTDNAAMIGLAAWYRLRQNKLPEGDFAASPRLPLDSRS